MKLLDQLEYFCNVVINFCCIKSWSVLLPWFCIIEKETVCSELIIMTIKLLKELRHCYIFIRVTSNCGSHLQVTTRRWASGVWSWAAGRSSGSPSPGPSSKRRRSSCWMRWGVHHSALLSSLHAAQAESQRAPSPPPPPPGHLGPGHPDGAQHSGFAG